MVRGLASTSPLGRRFEVSFYKHLASPWKRRLRRLSTLRADLSRLWTNIDSKLENSEPAAQ